MCSQLTNGYLPFFQPAPIAVGTQQRSPPACPGGRKWRATCRSSTSTFRGNTGCWRATRRTSSAGHPRRLGKSRWWYLESGPRQASLSGSPVICNKVGWMCGSIHRVRQDNTIIRIVRLNFYRPDALLTETSACRKEIIGDLPVQVEGGNLSSVSLIIREVEMIRQRLLFSREPARNRWKKQEAEENVEKL